MFDPEFYPTPLPVVKQMIKPYVIQSKKEGSFLKRLRVLEPSAGKGDIFKGITKATVPYEFERDEEGNRYELKPGEEPTDDGYDLKNWKIHCIEKNPQLRELLKQQGYKIVATDFLSYKPDIIYDLILMNPPFSNGDEHLLHAWEILDKGDVVCLLNKETIDNPFSEKRKLLLRIIEQYGSVEYLGQAFQTAERKTNVEVALVRLTKQTSSKFEFEFESVNSESHKKIDDSNINDMPAIKDVIGNMIIQYDKVKDEFIGLMKQLEALKHYGNPLMAENKQEKSHIVDLAIKAIESNSNKQEQYSTFCSWMKQELWTTVFQNLKPITSFNMESLMTSRIRKNWDSFVHEQGSMDFTKENVWSVIELIFTNRNQILEQCITDAFDLLTKHTKENRMIIEGWKTNDCWKVNKKFILPIGFRYGEYMTVSDMKKYGDRFKLNYSYTEPYFDIDKALAYILNRSNYTSIGEALDRQFQRIGNIRTGEKFENECESSFFHIKFHKKGTIHCVFKDEKLWNEFNMRACADKKWLPPSEEKEWKESKEPPKQEEKPMLMIEQSKEEQNTQLELWD